MRSYIDFNDSVSIRMKTLIIFTLLKYLNLQFNSKLW